MNQSLATWDVLEDEGVVRRDVPLAPFTSYKFGGPAMLLAEVGNPEVLSRIAETRREYGPEACLVLGRGSNVVVSDSGFPGLVIRLGGSFLDMSVHPSGFVTAGGGLPLAKLARESVRAERGGLEFLVGVPGSVGGAVKMNAGCLGSETADYLVEVTVIDLDTGEDTLRNAADLDFSYRQSNLPATAVVSMARFRTDPQDRAVGEERLREVTRWRREHQPGGTLNAGSVFKNPPSGPAAGELIDRAGCKGFRVGGASVSTKHANFFVASPKARAQDVFDLVDAVRARVADEFGTTLEPEIRFVGRFSRSESR